MTSSKFYESIQVTTIQLKSTGMNLYVGILLHLGKSNRVSPAEPGSKIADTDEP